MLDLKEIIRWLFPCFHILRLIVKMNEFRLTFVCVFLLFNFSNSFAAIVGDEVKSIDSSYNVTKNVDSYYFNSNLSNQSDFSDVLTPKSDSDVFVGRTFGRPFKKMMAALIPLVFQIGAASTWAVVAALVGVKTLAVTLLILKLLLVAGAAKIGALFGQKQHHHGWSQWEPPHHPQKEIHLHIHNGQHHEEHPGYSWSRDGTATPIESKNVVVVDPYAAGPQTISTPYGNYVRVHPGGAGTTNKRK